MSKNFTQSSFYCTKCGRKGIPLARKLSKQREKGHLKNLHCLYCGIETNHLERREYEKSEEEFQVMLKEAMENYTEKEK